MNYLINKIKNAKIIYEPFPHIIIHNFIEENDLKNILDNIEIDNLKDINEKYTMVHYPGAKLQMTY